MSLAARLVLEPSRRMRSIERALPMIGLVVAAATLIARWPGAVVGVLAGSVLVALVLVAAARRREARAPRWTIDVADRADLEVRSADLDGPFRLGESTLLWPGFALIALESGDGGRTVGRRALFLDECAADERRALERFLLWSLRARGGRSSDPRVRA